MTKGLHFDVLVGILSVVVGIAISNYVLNTNIPITMDKVIISFSIGTIASFVARKIARQMRMGTHAFMR